MTTLAAAASRPAREALRPFLLALAGGLIGLGLLFHEEAVAAVTVWAQSTAYSHCFLVLPIALWLAWDRRELTRGRRPQPTAWPLLAVLPCGLAWFAAERLGLMEGRQLAALGMLEATLVALLGWRLARVQAPALIYLVFLVPFGSYLVPALQRFTAQFIDVGLTLLGIPHYVDSFIIDIPEGTFYVAEACAGLRFLIAAVAFGVLYGFLTYRSVWRRLLFLVASMIVPVIANGFRALGIVVAGHIVGDAQAAAADHIIYGWGFFSVVIVLLALAGLPFREDGTPLAPPAAGADAPPARPARAILVAGLAVLLAAAGPAVATALDRGAGAPPALGLPGFAATAECLSLGDPPGAVQHFSCHGTPLVATLRVLPPDASPALLRAARIEITGEREVTDPIVSTLAVPGLTPSRWRLVEVHAPDDMPGKREPDHMTASAVWVDGHPDTGGLAARVRLAWESIAGGGTAPVLVAVTLSPPALGRSDQREQARQIVRRFLQAQAPLIAAIGAATRP